MSKVQDQVTISTRRRQASAAALTLQWPLFLTMLFVILAGCAIQPPAPIREPVPQSPDIAQVQRDSDRYSGTRVRWGGEIYAVKNLPSDTELEIIARALDQEASPQINQPSNGRFIALFKGFLEPSQFTQGRFITVIGTITGIRPGTIGAYRYPYPVLAVDSYYLWPEMRYEHYPYPRRYDPFFYDPWYPWYPWYPWWY